jgi:hypothetical protein
MNKILTLEALASAAKRPPEAVQIKTLNNATVHFRHMSAAERDTHENSVLGPKGEVDINKVKGIRQRLVSLTLCDEEGKRLTNSVAELDKLDAEVIDEMAEEAARINGMRNDSKDEAGKE